MSKKERKKQKKIVHDINYFKSVFLINLFYFFFIICVKSFSLGYTKLLVGVGKGLSGRLNSIEIIDLGSSSSSCQDLTNFPRKVYGTIGGLTSNKNPIICGGHDQSTGQIVSDCSTYEDGVWNSFPSMTTPRSFAAASTAPPSDGAHSLYVTGGQAEGKYPNTLEVLSDDGWHQLTTPLPVETIDRHCMVLLNLTTVMIIGGTQGESNYSTNTYFFNTDNGEWVAGPMLFSSKYLLSCGKILNDSQSHKESVIVAGGCDPYASSSVDILDLGASKWRKGPNLPIPICEASMVEDGFGGVLLIGGWNGTGYLDTLYQLSHSNSEWILMPQKLKFGRAFVTAFLVPDEITNCN